MKLIPEDIACHLYCPMLRKKGGCDKVVPPLPILESYIRQAIVLAEESALIKDNTVNTHKILRVWDRLWWPAAVQHNLDLIQAQDMAIVAAKIMAEYAKYDFTDYMYATVGTNIINQLRINDSVLHAHIDILKVDLNQDARNTVLIDFSRSGLSQQDIIRDPAIRTKAYAFYRDLGETIKYIVVQLDTKKKTLQALPAIFRPEDMTETRKMLYHVECGIRKNVTYYSPWLCKDCKTCKTFVS